MSQEFETMKQMQESVVQELQQKLRMAFNKKMIFLKLWIASNEKMKSYYLNLNLHTNLKVP